MSPLVGRSRGKSVVIRTATRMVVLLAMTAIVAGCDASARRSPALALCEGCNVVVISLDTLRADHVGTYGYNRPTTPNVDRLARESVVFENAISQSAWTRPAHASMLTGLYPAEHGILSVSRGLALAPDLPTLAGSLADHGYVTAAFTGGGNMSAHFGFDVGFDTYRSPGRRLADALDDIESWLDMRDDAPFFLFVHAFDPHRPHKSDPVDRAALGLSERKPTGGVQRACRNARSKADLAPFVAEYDAAIRHGDRAVGRLLELVERAASPRRTLVVFTSDHGEEFFDHGDCFHIQTLYREITHVPLIVRVPGVEPRRVSEIVPASVSIAPTVLDLVGVGSRRGQGPSLVSAIEGRRRPGFEYVVSETAIRYRNRVIGRVRALTGQQDKLVHWVAENRTEYFDLVRDPFEREPLVSPTRSRALLRHLDLWLASHPPRPSAVLARPLPVALKRELRALGYVD